MPIDITDVPLPPAIYDHAPSGVVEAHSGSLSDLEYLCHTQWRIVTNNVSVGCSWPSRGVWIVILPRIGGEVTPELQARVWRHEIGHVNGWPADHPGARYVP